jgi:hypothetical protein
MTFLGTRSSTIPPDCIFCEHGAFPDLRVVFRKTAAIMPSLDPTPARLTWIRR